MNYTTAQQKAIEFLESFTRSDFNDMKVYDKFKTYRSLHKRGKLHKGSYEVILVHLGYEKQETWKQPVKPSDKLIDILI